MDDLSSDLQVDSAEPQLPESAGSASEIEPLAAGQDEVTDALFQGGSPRWREVTAEPGGGERRRSHDQPAPTRDDQGAIEREP